MQQLQILNTRELKPIKELLKEQFDYSLDEDWAFLLNEKGRLFTITKDLSRLDLKKLKIDRYGLYFGEFRNDELRLSLEAAWLIGQKAKKNIVELTNEETKEYFLGEPLFKDLGEEKKFVLLRFNQDILGCAKYKDRKILNFLPKIHRGEVIL